MREITDAQLERIRAAAKAAKATRADRNALKAERDKARGKDLQKLSKAELIALVKELTG